MSEARPSALPRRLAEFASLIRLPHTVFSVPFAVAGAFLAARGVPEARVLAWVLACVVLARTSAMAFNRWADRDLDAANPRTAGREIPSGRVSPGAALALAVTAAFLFVAAAGQLNRTCLALSPVALAAVGLYSYSKRVTWLSHTVLGLCLAMAPLGAWIAVRGEMETATLALAAAVVLWLAGFDVVYALLDLDHDRRAGLRSLPVRLGPVASVHIARAAHGGAAALLAAVPYLHPVHAVYWVGWCVFAGLLAAEHLWLGRPPLDPRRIPSAVFTVNGWAGVVYGACTSLAAALA